MVPYRVLDLHYRYTLLQFSATSRPLPLWRIQLSSCSDQSSAASYVVTLMRSVRSTSWQLITLKGKNFTAAAWRGPRQQFPLASQWVEPWEGPGLPVHTPHWVLQRSGCAELKRIRTGWTHWSVLSDNSGSDSVSDTAARNLSPHHCLAAYINSPYRATAGYDLQWLGHFKMILRSSLGSPIGAATVQRTPGYSSAASATSAGMSSWMWRPLQQAIDRSDHVLIEEKNAGRRILRWKCRLQNSVQCMIQSRFQPNLSVSVTGRERS